ncbi:DUF58 domain-containing protein [Leptospira levettii]|uniref:DUF58 domain-containing protein n=1 Tax=Leptospira levettii TaxID=2023178 RepID=UPI00223E4576|nr:DUF58 domain-containing protein [Leptospira levettii]MCW7473148.1 DUF58 domain-containing protein [Leptospira levettii]
MLDPELKRLLQVLQWESKKKFNSNRRGLIFTNDKGRGLDFKEVRNYQYGDDIRYIDWNVTSRTGELHTKEFFEEKDATILIFIDLSQSMEGIKGKTAFQIALFLSLFHIKIGNRIFLISFSNHTISSNKWLKTETEVLTYFENLNKQKHGNQTNYTVANQYAFKIHPKYAVTYWISDFNHLAEWTKTFTIPKVWDQYGIWISDPIDELNFPFWLKWFQPISQESVTLKSSNTTYDLDKTAAKNLFGNKLIKINPSLKLNYQILPLFKTQKHG